MALGLRWRRVISIVEAFPAPFTVRWPSAGIGWETRKFRPRECTDTKWRDDLATAMQARRGQIDVTWFARDPNTLRARVDDDEAKALAQGELASANYDAVCVREGLDVATAAFEAAHRDYAKAEWALINYRPRNMADVAEKSGIMDRLYLLPDDDERLDAFLASLMPEGAQDA